MPKFELGEIEKITPEDVEFFNWLFSLLKTKESYTTKHTEIMKEIA